MPPSGSAWDVLGDGKTPSGAAAGCFTTAALAAPCSTLSPAWAMATSRFAPAHHHHQSAGSQQSVSGHHQPVPRSQPPPRKVCSCPGRWAPGRLHRNLVTPLDYNWNLAMERQIAGMAGARGILWARTVPIYATSACTKLSSPGQHTLSDQRRIFNPYSTIFQTSMDTNSCVSLGPVQCWSQPVLCTEYTLRANYTYSKSWTLLQWVVTQRSRYRLAVRTAPDGHRVVRLSITRSAWWSLRAPLCGTGARQSCRPGACWEAPGADRTGKRPDRIPYSSWDRTSRKRPLDRIGAWDTYGTGACSRRSCVDFLNHTASFALPSISAFGNMAKTP